jgi:hypothetical protein
MRTGVNVSRQRFHDQISTLFQIANPQILNRPHFMFYRPLTFLRFLPFFVATVANAALQFTDTSLVIKATPQDRELQARYTFTNSGPEPIWIVQLNTSCGCTKAVADKTEYQPGETGTITATYTIGLSQGRHSHTINIQTSEPNTPPYILKLTAELPSGTTPLANTTPAVVLVPRELVWSRPPYATKTISITLNDSTTTKLTATCDSDQFELKLDETVRPSTLQVTPKASAASTRAEITVLSTPAEGPPIAQKIPLTLLSLRGAKSQ